MLARNVAVGTATRYLSSLLSSRGPPPTRLQRASPATHHQRSLTTRDDNPYPSPAKCLSSGPIRVLSNSDPTALSRHFRVSQPRVCGTAPPVPPWNGRPRCTPMSPRSGASLNAHESQPSEPTAGSLNGVVLVGGGAGLRYFCRTPRLPGMFAPEREQSVPQRSVLGQLLLVALQQLRDRDHLPVLLVLQVAPPGRGTVPGTSAILHDRHPTRCRAGSAAAQNR